MAAATLGNASGSPDENITSSQRIPTNSAGRRHQRAINAASMDYENDPSHISRASDFQRAHSISYKNNLEPIHDGRGGRSFAARTRDLPEFNKALLPEPSDLSNEDGQADYSADPGIPLSSPDVQEHDIRKESSPVGSGQASSGRRSAKDQKHDWAHDRSPLQKLEVAFNGFSKEEKRARALEAEMKLKERMARGQSEGNNRGIPPANPRNIAAPEDMSHKATNPERAVSNRRPKYGQSNVAREGGIQAAKHPEQAPSDGEPFERHHGRALSLQYAETRPSQQPQYARGNPLGPTVRRGEVPRRSVTISKHPGTNGRHMPPETQNFLEDTSAPKRAGTQVRQLPDPVTMRPTFKQRDQPMALDPDDRQIGRRQQSMHVGSHNPGMNAQPQQRGVYPEQGEVGQAAPANFGFDPRPSYEVRGQHQGPQNGASPQSKPKRQTVSFNVPPPTPPPVLEWKNAPVTRLDASDFDFQNFDLDRSKAWWEGGGTANRRQSRALPNQYHKPVQKPKASKSFQPPIFLKCGPLLRYTGMKRTQIDGPTGPYDKETWRGSILIVTKDSRSSYESPPTLRLFSQPMNLLPPPPVEVSSEEGGKLAPEYVDPTAGLMKLGRDGRPLYIKPVDHTEEEVDLSFVENDDGIYELSPSIIDYSSEGVKQPVPANRVHSIDGEAVGAYKEIAGVRLCADPSRDVTFWRFKIEVELGPTQQRIAYRINQGPALGFWVPARGQPMNIMFHTCNGFSTDVDSNKFSGPDPLWRDVINEHQTRPFHVMIGGGDQIFNDRVIWESTLLQAWLKTKNEDKYDIAFTKEFKAELESFYLDNYSRWFSQGLFSFANSQIPMVNIWNDHEIIEGFGSYPDEFMGTPVISGLGRVAFKYYLLFQHHSVPEETEEDEPSWILGAQLGPYINQKSRNLFTSLGKGISFLGLDCRTERMNNEVLSEQTCDLIWDRCHREIVKGDTKHLIVLSSVPVAYPRVAMLKNIINSRKSLGKAGIFGGFVNKHGANVEIYDDHWTAKHHKSERTFLIEDLQDLAAEKSVRVTILSGDVHLAAIGQFFSNPKLDLPKDKDYRYIPNVISSAIADAPETEMISDMLNKRNRVHHMDSNTDEDVIPIFTDDVDHKPRNNKRLLPRRNWCSIREYQPGTTPPGTPDSEPTPEPAEPAEPRPGMLQRTLSLTRGDKPAGRGGLLRRLSMRGPPPTRPFSFGRGGRRMSMDGPFPPAETGDSYFPQQPEPQPGPFLRRPTNLSQKAAKKAVKQGDDGVGGYVNLEGGLAITLNLEVNPKDPSGITTPYKLLVPTLRYEGNEYDPPPTQVTKGWKKWLGVRRKQKQNDEEEEEGSEEDEPDDERADYEPEEAPSETFVPMKQPEDSAGRGLRKKLFGRLG